MFNQSILVLVITTALLATFAFAAPNKIFRRHVQHSYKIPLAVELSSQKESLFDDSYERENEAVQSQLSDEALEELAKQVAEVDYVPLPKYAYETGNEELAHFESSDEIVETSKNHFDDNESEDPKGSVKERESLFGNSDEQFKTNEERDQETIEERLKNLEGQILVEPHIENKNEQLERGDENYIIPKGTDDEVALDNGDSQLDAKSDEFVFQFKDEQNTEREVPKWIEYYIKRHDSDNENDSDALKNFFQ